VVSRLIDDELHRAQMGALCKEQIHLLRGNPERMVRRYESVYSKIIENSSQGKGLLASGDRLFGIRRDILRKIRTSLTVFAIKVAPSLSKPLYDLLKICLQFARKMGAGSRSAGPH
jgi:hypothetical protein